MKRTYIPALYCCECGNEAVEGELQYKYKRKQIVCAQCLKRKMGSRKLSRLTGDDLLELLKTTQKEETERPVQRSVEALENRIAELEAEIEGLKEQLDL